MKLLSSLLVSVGTLVATIGTHACPLFVCDEPKMPKSLLNK